MKPQRIAASPRPVAMTIAGSDPSGGAGLQADIKTFAALKVYGLSVLTTVVAQNSARVDRLWPADPEMVVRQMNVIVKERKPDAVKIGVLATAAVASAVADNLQALRLPAPVIDPVVLSSSGWRLLEREAIEVMRTQLIPLACLITPNLPEAQTLSGIKIKDPDTMREAAVEIHKLGPCAVLIKGGHTPKHQAVTLESTVIDLFFDGRRFVEFAAPRIPGEGAHGTGCALSAAITAWLARGATLELAVERARQFMTDALKNAFSIGKGGRLLDHFASHEIFKAPSS